MANKRVDYWIKTLTFSEDVINEWGERYPDQIQKVNDYKNVIEDIYNHNKQGVIGQSVGDKIREAVENAPKGSDDWRVEQDICDDYFAVEPSC